MPPAPAQPGPASGREYRSAAVAQRNTFCAKGLAHMADQSVLERHEFAAETILSSGPIGVGGPALNM